MHPSPVGPSGPPTPAPASRVAAAVGRIAEDLLYSGRVALLRGSAAGALRDAHGDRAAPPEPAEILIEGDDPVVVVLIGHGGLELGHSTARRSDGVGPQLADRLHAATGRGVRLTTLVAPQAIHAPITGHGARLGSRVQEQLASSAPPAPDLVVYAHDPEEVLRASRRAGRSRVRSLLLWCERMPWPPTVALAGVPAPRVRTAAGRLADRQCRAVERDLVRLAASYGPRASFLPVPSYASVSTPLHLDPEYYAEVARDVTRRFVLDEPARDGDAPS